MQDLFQLFPNTLLGTKKAALTGKEAPYSGICSPLHSLHLSAGKGDEQNQGHKIALLRYVVIKDFDNLVYGEARVLREGGMLNRERCSGGIIPLHPKINLPSFLPHLQSPELIHKGKLGNS